LSREDPSPDRQFSLEPAEFRAMADAIRTVEKATGGVHFGVSAEEARSRVFRRSLFVVESMCIGEAFTRKNLRSIRPGYGLPPKHIKQVLGRRATQDIARGTPLSWDLVARP
ncbi:MAG: SAF domain-containing protein, partial [Thermoanaerobaculia bacterium]